MSRLHPACGVAFSNDEGRVLRNTGQAACERPDRDVHDLDGADKRVD